jgi:hypothetical protein
MDRAWTTCDQSALADFFDELEAVIDGIPAAFVYNVDELGKVKSIQGTDYLEYVDLFTQLMIDPVVFQDFVKKFWSRLYIITRVSDPTLGPETYMLWRACSSRGQQEKEP